MYMMNANSHVNILKIVLQEKAVEATKQATSTYHHNRTAALKIVVGRR
jgi:hypothetical protein